MESTSTIVSKNLPVGIQIVIPVKYNGYLKVREFLYSQVIIWVNTILNHIDTKAVYLGMERFLHGIQIQMISKTKTILKYPNPTGIKICENLITHTQVVS